MQQTARRILAWSEGTLRTVKGVGPKPRPSPAHAPATASSVVDYYAKQRLYSPVNADQPSATVKSIVAAILSK